MRNLRFSILSGGALLFLAPYIWMLSTAAKSREEIFSFSLSLWPKRWALWEDLGKAFTHVPMTQLPFNGLIVCALIFVLQVVIAVPCAYAVSKLKFRAAQTMTMVLLGLRVLIHATALPIYLVLNQIGMLNSYFALSAPFSNRVIVPQCLAGGDGARDPPCGRALERTVLAATRHLPYRKGRRRLVCSSVPPRPAMMMGRSSQRPW
jgi:ABC-type glycerol-3-phosphate transport system permease component